MKLRRWSHIFIRLKFITFIVSQQLRVRALIGGRAFNLWNTVMSCLTYVRHDFLGIGLWSAWAARSGKISLPKSRKSFPPQSCSFNGQSLWKTREGFQVRIVFWVLLYYTFFMVPWFDLLSLFLQRSRCDSAKTAESSVDRRNDTHRKFNSRWCDWWGGNTAKPPKFA